MVRLTTCRKRLAPMASVISAMPTWSYRAVTMSRNSPTSTVEHSTASTERYVSARWGGKAPGSEAITARNTSRNARFARQIHFHLHAGAAVLVTGGDDAGDVVGVRRQNAAVIRDREDFGEAPERWERSVQDVFHVIHGAAEIARTRVDSSFDQGSQHGILPCQRGAEDEAARPRHRPQARSASG